MTVSTAIVNFESPYSSYLTWRPAGWETKYPASRFFHIVYDLKTFAEFKNAAALSKSRRAGAVYFTPLSGQNPYSSLPNATFWAQELAWARSAAPP
jgi:hypothetical protein